ncbi:hypothetical protein JHK85_008011 [Glycine max]|nr:hypothetical protein JHK87_007629 [Glycine soja]KAG5055501.1 hypothetical protein JHK85_008011 [Glycine max]
MLTLNHSLQHEIEVPLVGTDWSWMMEFLKGMVKPVAATAVVCLAVALSFYQKLGLELEMVVAIVRAFIQLSIIGFVLEFIFRQDNAGWILLAYLFMVSIAGYTAGQRAKHVPRGKYVAGASILTGTAVTMLVLVALSVFPFTPRYIIPVAGMMVGNSMTVTGVTMKRLRDDIKTQMNLPLTNFSGKKCKRCGIYEEDIFSDDVFDEWELCPSDFTTPDGRYAHFKEKEFNASFLCPECLSFSGVSVSAPPAENHNPNKKGMNVAVIILLSILGSTILILGMLGTYKYWQKRKREQDQARFLKLFEEGDDIEDELGLGTII